MTESLPVSRRTRVTFGVFEFDLRTGELRKGGARVRLAGQPARILARLVQRPGDLVTRDELRSELWTDSTFVDFERNLNSAMKRLRAALGDAADTPRFIETLPRRGYRFVAPVAYAADEPAAAGVRAESDHGRTPGPARGRWISGGTAAGLALLACIAVLVMLAARPRPQPRAYYAIAVLPFVLADADSTEDEYLAFGVAEALITELSRLGGPRVISQTSSLRYRNAGEKLPQIARELGVDAVVEGSVQREGSRVRITVQLIEAATDTHLWADTYEREIGSVLAVADEVARAVARQIHVQIAPGVSSTVTHAIDPGVARAYLLGRYYLGKGTEADFARARSQFEAALAIDPGHAPSHAGLSDYFVVTDAMAPAAAFARAKSHARRAIELDDELPDAHASLAFVHFYYDWDWAAAEREFRRALGLNPGHARARRWYGLFLSAMRRHTEAIEQIDAALAVDPLAIVNHDAAATVRLHARRYEEAAATGRTIAELDRFDLRGYEHQAMALILSQQSSSALALVEQGLATSGDHVVLELARVLALARLARVAEAEQQLAEMTRTSRRPYVSDVLQGIARLALNQPARALDHLERAHAARDPYLVLLGVSPWFDSLREQTRFRRLYERLGFPPNQ